MSKQIHLLLLAAGSGRRFAADANDYSVPKQYIKIAGQTVLEHSLSAFDNSPLTSVVIALNPDDTHFADIKLNGPFTVMTAVGGQTRADSVRLGLQALQQGGAADSDWVLVHDAARCCVTEQEIKDLIQVCVSAQRGGLLVNPINDTLKFSQDGQQVDKTIKREQVYAALTPQMFVLGDLLSALTAADQQGMTITDESSAMEAMGERPLMVSGRASNIKLTRAEQLPQVESFLSHLTALQGE
ncbi:2-C-methyl-D-erythritol 4-phosphate cytidylyltransferase [Marinicella gelatinilytica]|uniref:2-C-methyl-D-erythritol 4-phosphate cytidylyltransferase n=1 Tax=Marinicella gelatinilytica TaxID=2996017 RepID=UPI002260CE43|nr:2-C-methyl-D-erythritol 4-phosphate cytidylyltransferase [Marinicella gelatinilytica]MCX7545894.1 2-C-methyl-D-erythritol 4-phosphate cytidylyltransferase [Marinicella gelatinilytica]